MSQNIDLLLGSLKNNPEKFEPYLPKSVDHYVEVLTEVSEAFLKQQEESPDQGLYYKEKNPGDLIESEDWNEMMKMIAQLQNDKVNRTGQDSISGPLSVEGNLGIGTVNPSFGLEINKNLNQAFRMGPGGDSGRIWSQYKNMGPNLIFYDKDDPCFIRFRQSPDTNNEDNPEHEAYITGKNGKIGIGTTSPSETLHVNGKIKLEGSEALYALGALSTLKVVIGYVNKDGDILSGDGFEVNLTNTGRYTINFLSSFQSMPVILGSSAEDYDHILTVRSISKDSFCVRIHDQSTGNYQKSGFTFIALGNV